MSKSLPKDETKKALELVRHLEKQPEAKPFLKPLDYKALNLLDYPEIIKKPMDLSTLKKNLKSSVYKDFEEFIGDLQLVWSNCKAYNPPDSVFTQHADAMEAHMNNLLKSLPSKRPREDSLEFHHRVEFSEKLRLVPHNVVAQVVEVISRSCPAAIVQLPQEKLQMKVTEIDSQTFKSCLQ